MTTVRLATQSDIYAIVKLEQSCFPICEMSNRQWRYMLSKAHADVFVVEYAGEIVGCVLVIYNKVTSIARIYSIAVATQVRRLGLGRLLVNTAEQAALKRNRVHIRLEIRLDNAASIGLFESLGYKKFGYYKEYYKDKMDAVRYEKLLQ